MSRIRYCLGGVAAAAASYKAHGACGVLQAEEPRTVSRIVLEPHDNNRELALKAASEPLTWSRVFFNVRVLFRGVYLLTNVVVPLLWACALHLVSERLVSRDTINILLLRFFTSSGPCFLKLGQWAATRPDKFSKEFCDVVGKLHHDAPSHSWEDSEARIVAAYGATDMFESIERGPLHSGCIAQVHRARLKGEDRDVVIKVMHPGLEEIIEADLAIARWGLAVVSRLIPQSEWLSLKESFAEFDGLMRSQMNFCTEAQNLSIFCRNFEGHKDVVFPKVIPNMATECVLVESFEEGVPMTEWREQNTSTASNKEVSLIGCRAFLKMVFEDNFFHADLHPGNILVRSKEDGTHQMVLLDTGLVSSLSKQDRKNFIHLFAAVCVGDGELGADLMLAGAKKQECTDPARFRQDMKQIVDAVNCNLLRSFKLKDIKIGKVLIDTMDSVRTNKVKIDPNFTTLVMAIVVLEGVGRSLMPDLNIFRVAAPYVIPHVEVSDVKQLSPLIKKMYL